MCNRLNWDPSSITNMGEASFPYTFEGRLREIIHETEIQALCAKGVRAIVSALDVLPEIGNLHFFAALDVSLSFSFI